MGWRVGFTKKAAKEVAGLPKNDQIKLKALVDEIAILGPVRGNWPNYSKLSEGSHHCHLSYRWVACWRETENGISVEVYYVGSRKEAPY